MSRYCGKLSTGRIFDQTKGNKHFVFRLGVGEVIRGWDKGIDGMRVGDKRKLTVSVLSSSHFTATVSSTNFGYLSCIADNLVATSPHVAALHDMRLHVRLEWAA